MTKVTTKEFAALAIFAKGCNEANGAESADAMKEDNMSWTRPSDVRKALRIKAEAVGGLFTSLEAKGLIQDSGEVMDGGVSKRATKNTDWTLTDAGIDSYFATMDQPKDVAEDVAENADDPAKVFKAAFLAHNGDQPLQLCKALRATAADWTFSHKQFRDAAIALGLNGNNATAEFYAGRKA